ncbi:dessication-associated protein [Adhaeribacter arboris]|uniref:Dessication-associated protein n=1 Tax=Adhaeribacter arboris TaxID=2072846 RepID=A0A2T2YJN7_9BACT|nr:ferritin-like domain-containing protein [Adhaeribacter arboris]PSR55726.1 dessication-associated protein [Adhaeribacter arboris]
MNILNIFSEIEKVDPEVYERFDSRRQVFKYMSGFGKKLAAAAVPVAFGAVFNKAYGQTGNNADIIAILNFALTAELTDSTYYGKVLAANSPDLPAEAKAGLQIIFDNEKGHVATLQKAITDLGGTPITIDEARLDYTAGGKVPDPFTNYATILALGQAFEDTGVRAYKGQAPKPALMNNNAVLQTALQIHSAEARHAAYFRRMRRMSQNQEANKPWITGNNRGGLPEFAQAVYAGEEATTQANVNIASIVAGTVASEAFDEPLEMAQVIAILNNFFKEGQKLPG